MIYCLKTGGQQSHCYNSVHGRPENRGLLAFSESPGSSLSGLDEGHQHWRRPDRIFLTQSSGHTLTETLRHGLPAK